MGVIDLIQLGTNKGKVGVGSNDRTNPEKRRHQREERKRNAFVIY
jgi:hypothetical protein